MSLRKKILIGYGITLGLMAAIMLWAVVNLVSLGRASDAILRENYKSILAAENMIDAIERQDSAALLTLLEYREEGLTQFRENETSFLQWLGRAKDNITIEGEADILRSIEEGYSDYLVAFSTLRGAVINGQTEASPYYHETVLRAFKVVRNECTSLREINQSTMFKASGRAGEVAARAIWSTCVVALTALALGLGFSLLLSARLAHPVREMIRAADALAEGDYEVRTPEVGSDEVSRLAARFNAMAERLAAYHRLNVEKVVAEKQKSDAVMRSIEDGVIVVNDRFLVTAANPPAGRILGVDSDSMLEKHFLNCVRIEPLFDLLKQVVESGMPPDVEEGSNILSLGSEDAPRHYLYGATPVLSKGGGMLGAVLLLRDVTRLKELDRMKDEFIMTASHELKTPLQSLGMSIDLLKEGTRERLDEKQKHLLAAAGEELARLKSLIGDLLDLSRIEAGRLELDFERIPPSLLAEKGAAVLMTQAQERTIVLKIDLPDDLPDVRVDANKMTWVLTNLIANALRYVDDGGHVEVRGWHGGRWIHISVSDDGEGIPQELQSRIFEKFVQVKGSKSVGGSGLGLAICREIIRAHGGTIWVDSEPGKGSTFTFTVPVDASQRGKESRYATDGGTHC